MFYFIGTLMYGLSSDINLTLKVYEEKVAQFVRWIIKSHTGLGHDFMFSYDRSVQEILAVQI